MDSFKTVDEFILNKSHWQEELVFLRKLMNSTEMEETVKWGMPTYTIEGKNVVGLGAFKDHFGIWFFQGVFLKDKKKILVNVQEGTTQGMRHIKYFSFDEMNEKVILEYVNEAIANQKAGKMIKPKKKELVIPDELRTAMENDSIFKEKFESFTPGKQREFADHISSAKREETRLDRLEKIKPMILNGIGLNDKYKK